MPDHDPAGNSETPATTTSNADNADNATDVKDAGMYEAGTPSAIERRLLHVDRVTEETLVMVRATNQQLLMTIAMIAILGGMVYLLHREIAALDLGLEV